VPPRSQELGPLHFISLIDLFSAFICCSEPHRVPSTAKVNLLSVGLFALSVHRKFLTFQFLLPGQLHNHLNGTISINVYNRGTSFLQSVHFSHLSIIPISVKAFSKACTFFLFFQWLAEDKSSRYCLSRHQPSP
jgi:hypothetical protein